jgi:hypothetical protein
MTHRRARASARKRRLAGPSCTPSIEVLVSRRYEGSMAVDDTRDSFPETKLDYVFRVHTASHAWGLICPKQGD